MEEISVLDLQFTLFCYRFRCLAFLEQLIEEFERAEQERMEERQVSDFQAGSSRFCLKLKTLNDKKKKILYLLYF